MHPLCRALLIALLAAWLPSPLAWAETCDPGDLAARLAELRKELWKALPEGQADLTALEQEQLAQGILPILGIRLPKTGPVSYRACMSSTHCALFSGREGEKDLEVVWSATAEAPEIRNSPTTRTLVIPQNMPTPDLVKQSEPLVHRWTVGHSLHPYISDDLIKAEKKALGVEGIQLRPTQRDAIESGVRNYAEGQQSFLYVSPTGTGKTEVLKGILEARIAAPENTGKVHIMVAHQTELVGQFADDIADLEKAGKIEVIREFDLKALTAEQKPPPKVLAMTIQGLESAVSQLSPGDLQALRAKLGTLVFDEAHHAGAPTYLATLKALLEKNPGAKLLGATATPVHRQVGIQKLFNELFEGRSFWAYLDAGKEAEGVERGVKQVVQQLDRAIQNGDLTPLDHFYVMDPKSFGSEAGTIFSQIDPNNSMLGYHIDPKSYQALASRLTPLIERHKSGFLAANSVDEANNLKLVFEKAMPGKKFEVFHGDLSTGERQAIRDRIKGGEDLFLITVNLLDEGVNFPRMSLYVDLNRSLGARQLLQRWGRVARLAPLKEGVEIATLTDWRDAATIGDKLDILDAFAESNPKSPVFKGGGTAHTAAPVQIEGILPIDDATKRRELQTLRDQTRKMLSGGKEAVEEASPRSPTVRSLTARVRGGQSVEQIMLKDSALNDWIKALPEDSTQWPPMDEDIREALLMERRRPDILSRLAPIVTRGSSLPTSIEDPEFHRWIDTLPKNPKNWPTMPAEIKDRLVPWIKAGKPKINFGSPPTQAVPGLLERLAKRLDEGKGLPKPHEDQEFGKFLSKLPNDLTQWPAMDPRVREAILDIWLPTVAPPLAYVTAYVQAGRPLLARGRMPGEARAWIQGLGSDPDKWRTMLPKVKDELVAWIKANMPEKQVGSKEAVRSKHVLILTDQVRRGYGLPSPEINEATYKWMTKLPPDPALWPGMDPDIKEVILLDRRRDEFLRHVTSLVSRGLNLPTPIEDPELFRWINSLSKDPRHWPSMSPSNKQAIKKYLGLPP